MSHESEQNRGAITLHPSVLELRARRERLRSELAGIVEERIRILFEEIPGLRLRYTELFGSLERQVEEKTLEHAERKRLMELFLLKIDRGQELDEATITLTLKAVYREFDRVRSRINRVAEQSERSGGTDSPFSGTGRPNGADGSSGASGPKRTKAQRRAAERREIKSIYRRLAKRLHPDVLSSPDELARTYWQLTRRAMEREDLDLLRTLANVVDTGPVVGRTFETGGPNETAEEILRLIATIERERRTLEEIRTSEPWTLRSRLDDDAWIARMRSGLEEKIAEIEQEIERCNEFLAPILSRTGRRFEPETVGEVWSSFLDEAYFSGRR